MSEKNSIKAMQDNSYLFSGNFSYLEELYELYLRDPNAVSQEWRDCFSRWAKGNGHDVSHEAIRQEFLQLAKQPAECRAPTGVVSFDAGKVLRQGKVSRLINAYRSHGHRHATLDPLGTERQQIPDLSLEYHGLSTNDLDEVFSTNSFSGVGKNQATLREILEALQRTYCNTLGIEYTHIVDTEQTHWLEKHIENPAWRQQIPVPQKKKILQALTSAEGLEKYLHKKYVGQKRFSLEGGESLIPMLNEIVFRGVQVGTEEIVIGMAHRGRLNVLVNVLGKAPKDLFQEFEGKYMDEDQRTGDVKYHMGFSSDLRVDGKSVHLALGFNPSHLEIISPVIEGSVRSRQERRHDSEHDQVVPIIIHGDAAFAGQGVVMETFGLSQVRGYKTGGTVHIIINNQIGFTTSNPLDARSTLYCTDVAKMVQAPVIHVNGDDPDAVVFASQIAFDFRMKFKKDVVIDLVCYRRHGHNESDEPSITQPIMYKNINGHITTLELYSKHLVAEGVVTQEDVDVMAQNYRETLDAGKEVIERDPASRAFAVDWSPYIGQPWTAPANTGISHEKLMALALRLEQLPLGFSVQKQVMREVEYRRQMALGELPLNWGYAETLAYASLLEEGYAVRISGQDSCRGTFSHRHAVLHDSENGDTYTPLAHVAADQAHFAIFDSILSEEAVLGFEYGYASAEPQTLVIWEAQFGDFFNGAQVLIDQFISSGEQKWGRLCGLTLFLPHGYEGMGPEHSSARLERFLQLCAQHNMQVCVPTTPAQCFHMLRRQMIRPFRKPLIVMTPKSLLRHKAAVSTLAELENGCFQPVIPEVDKLDPAQVTRLVFCSGKVYYELLEARREAKFTNVALLRIEQLYPFPEQELKAIIALYPAAKEVIWCQEEPKNQGAWYTSQHHIRACLRTDQTLEYAGREAAAAPAVGYMSLHIKQQQALIKAALS